MQKPNQEAASPETRLIPLNKLRHDDRNVRGGAENPANAQADAELTASIRAHGLLENLVVTPRTKTLFGVAAGARRLRALNALAEGKHIPKTHPVPCLVVDNDAARESSLAENAVRIAMHPADQVAAFSKLAAEGATAAQIAARFGVAERTVQKRIRLGGLPEEIIDAYREGRINADAAEAFALTADGALQRSVFQALEDAGQLHGHAVRHAISQRRARSDAPIAVYVGLEAYRAAGGRTEDPLFEDDHVAILDPEIMDELAQCKLNAVAAEYAADWKWTATQAEFTWADQQNYLIADADERAGFTDGESAAVDEAETRIEDASVRLDGDIDAEERRELWGTIAREQARCLEIERARADRDGYAEAVRAHGGVVVALDRSGGLDIRRGLVRAEDAAAYRAARYGTGGDGAATPDAPDGSTDAPGLPSSPDGAAPAKRNGGWTDALRNDLRVMRAAAVRRTIARDPAVAADLIGFTLARMVGFGRRQPGYESAVLAIRPEYQGVHASDAMRASEVMKRLAPEPAVELGWLAEDDAALAFRAYRALPDADRASVLAHAVASLTVPRLADDPDVSGAHEEAVRDLAIDFPAELAAVGAKPFDADLVWSRMSKGLILGAAADALGAEWAAEHAGLRKKDLVAAAAEAFRHDPAREAAVDAAATHWLPPGFAPAAKDAERAPGETPGAAAGSGADGSADRSGSPTEAPSAGDAAEGAPAGAAGNAEPADGPDALPAFLTS